MPLGTPARRMPIPEDVRKNVGDLEKSGAALPADLDRMLKNKATTVGQLSRAEDDAYVRFHKFFDGQTVVLEDYLEVYPQDRPRIERQVRAGRLTFGPFYVLPDTFLISGESLIRNGLIGQALAESFGRSSRQGYVADPFGLISQTPQIFAGHRCSLLIAGHRCSLLIAGRCSLLIAGHH